jgi:hypothetical protein
VTKAQKPTKAKEPYVPTEAERAAIQRVRERRKGQAPTPSFKFSEVNGTASLGADHDDPATALLLLADALGTGDIAFAEGLLLQLAKASRSGNEFAARELNLALATVHAIAPRDATEALLASHMALVHQATLVAARRLHSIETIDQQNSASNMFNKLARTFTMQMDALKRYRSSGEQKVTVHHQHVSVTAQQAVVGVRQGGGGCDENGSQSHALGENAVTGPADACRPALLSQEQALGMPMPSAGCEGQERVPDARRARWGSEGQG